MEDATDSDFILDPVPWIFCSSRSVSRSIKLMLAYQYPSLYEPSSLPPPVRFMFPHIFLSPHFLTEEQRTELNASKHEKIIAKTKDFSAALKKREKSEQLSFLYKASDMV